MKLQTEISTGWKDSNEKNFSGGWMGGILSLLTQMCFRLSFLFFSYNFSYDITIYALQYNLDNSTHQMSSYQGVKLRVNIRENAFDLI